MSKVTKPSEPLIPSSYRPLTTNNIASRSSTSRQVDSQRFSVPAISENQKTLEELQRISRLLEGQQAQSRSAQISKHTSANQLSSAPYRDDNSSLSNVDVTSLLLKQQLNQQRALSTREDIGAPRVIEQIRRESEAASTQEMAH